MDHPYGGLGGYYGVWGYAPSDYYISADNDVYHFDGSMFNPLFADTDVPEEIWAAPGGEVFGITDTAVVSYIGGTWSSEIMGSPLTAVWGSSASDVFVTAGDDTTDPTSGWIRHFDGTTWVLEHAGDICYEDIWGFSSTEVYAVGFYWEYDPYSTTWPIGNLIKYNGVSWGGAGFSSPINAPYCIWGTSSTDLFVGGVRAYYGSMAKICHYNGSTWSCDDFPSVYTIDGIWGSASDDVYAFCSLSPLAKIFHYDGVTWTEMIDTGATIYDIFGISSTDVIAACRDKLLRYDGTDWTRVTTSSTDGHIEGIWSSSPDDVFAVSSDGAILHYNGLIWSDSFNNPDYSFYDVWGASPTDVYAVGGSKAIATILRYDGSTWTEMDIILCFYEFEGVWGFSPSDLYVVGSKNGVLRYNGVTWTFLLRGSPYVLYDMWGTAPDNLYVAGEEGRILHYNGAGWSQMSVPTTEDLTCIWGTAATDIYAEHIHFDGTTWSSVDMGLNDVYDIWGYSATEVYAVGRTYIKRYMTGYDGVTWTPVLNQPPIVGLCIWGAAPDNIYVGGYGGQVLHYPCSPLFVPPTVPVQWVFLLLLLIPILKLRLNV